MKFKFDVPQVILAWAVIPFVAGAVAVPASANFIHLLADSTATITYNNGVDNPVFVSGIGNTWKNPNFIFLNLVDSPGGGPGVNNFFTAVTHSAVNLGGNNAATALNIPQNSFFYQNNPGGNLQEASLKIDFTIALQADVLGGSLHSLAGFYLITYNLPGQSTGKFNAEFNYHNISTGQNNILAQQTIEFEKQGDSGQSLEQFSGSAAPANVAANEVVNVTGFLEWKWHHVVGGGLAGDEGPIGMEFKHVPGPGGIAILLLAGLARSRRRA